MNGPNAWVFVQRALQLLLSVPALCVLTGAGLLVASLWLASGFFRSSVSRRMNVKQRWLVCLAGSIGYVMLLYPPWMVSEQLWEREVLEHTVFPSGPTRAADPGVSPPPVFTRVRSTYAPFYVGFFPKPPRRGVGLYPRPVPLKPGKPVEVMGREYVIVSRMYTINTPRLLIQFGGLAVVTGGLFLALRDRTRPTEADAEWDWQASDAPGRPAIHEH
ncbi:MAG: hypothetical protein GY778_03045 [bacterium]|nr:hypothetical protein [bacterium]